MYTNFLGLTLMSNVYNKFSSYPRRYKQQQLCQGGAQRGHRQEIQGGRGVGWLGSCFREPKTSQVTQPGGNPIHGTQ